MGNTKVHKIGNMEFVPYQDIIKIRKAVDDKDIGKIKNFLDINSDSYIKNSYGTALNRACEKGYIDMVKILFSLGTENHSHQCQSACLSLSIENKHTEIVKYLIQSGFSIKDVQHNLETTIVKYCNTEFIQYLIESGLELTNSFFETMIKQDKLETFKTICDKIPKEFNVWKLSYRNNAFKIMEYLLDSDTKLDFSDVQLLGNLLINGKAQLIKKILNRIPDHRTFLLEGSLNLACRSSNIELIKLLLELGFDPNEKKSLFDLFGDKIDKEKYKTIGKSDYTPLENVLFTSKNSLELSKLLLQYGAEPTPYSLLLSTNKWHVFQLIYNSKPWSKLELTETLIEALEEGVQYEIWRFLHNQIVSNYDSGLKTEDLQRIIDFCMDTDEEEVFDYFWNFYGRERIEPLINYSKCNDEFKDYLKEMGLETA